MARNESTVYVGNLSEKVTEDLLYELFIQAGPVANVNIPSDRGRPKPFGFVQFKHPCSVLYAIHLLDGICMFGKSLRLNLPKGSALPMPPMGLPAMTRRDFIHPPSFHARLGPPPKNYGDRGDYDDHDDSRDRRRSHRRDDMKPSSRHRKNRKADDNVPEIDLDALPDMLDPFGPPVPSHGPPKTSHGHGRREYPYDDRGSRPESHRDRRSHRPSNKRRHF